MEHRFLHFKQPERSPSPDETPQVSPQEYSSKSMDRRKRMTKRMKQIFDEEKQRVLDDKETDKILETIRNEMPKLEDLSGEEKRIVNIIIENMESFRKYIAKRSGNYNQNADLQIFTLNWDFKKLSKKAQQVVLAYFDSAPILRTAEGFEVQLVPVRQSDGKTAFAFKPKNGREIPRRQPKKKPFDIDAAIDNWPKPKLGDYIED